MKLNKLLTPILGLATVTTIVAPIATSCSTEEVKHVKTTPIDDVTSSNKEASFLLVLDSHNYDENGFAVSVKVADDDKSGAISSDFQVTKWKLGGDHLTVNVLYNGPEPEDDSVTVKLNLNVSYGTQWKETVNVKFSYVNSPIKMVYNEDEEGYTSDTNKLLQLTQGNSYTVTLKYDTEIASFAERVEVKFLVWDVDATEIPFENIEVWRNGDQLIKDQHYSLTTKSGGYTRINFINEQSHYTWVQGDEFEFKFINCLTTSNNILAFAA